MPCSATFLLEVSEPISLKVTTENYFRSKNAKNLHFWRYSSKSKKEECDQRDLNISDQFETLIPC